MERFGAKQLHDGVAEALARLKQAAEQMQDGRSTAAFPNSYPSLIHFNRAHPLTPQTVKMRYNTLHGTNLSASLVLRGVRMLSTIHAVVRDGKIELLEPVDLPDGALVLVTVLTDDERTFWQQASESAIIRVWDNAEDDIYAELLTP